MQQEVGQGEAISAKSGPEVVAKMAETDMRVRGDAIREMPITRRPSPVLGSLGGRVVAKDDRTVAIATAANRFVLVEWEALGDAVQIGQLRFLRFSGGRAVPNDYRDRAR